MKTTSITILLILISAISFAQNAQVVVFKHELRWTDETKFPNYFLYQDIRDSIFKDTKLELMKYLKVNEVVLPKDVSYKIFNGFGKQKVEMPKMVSNKDFEIGIFSFITRATYGFGMLWKFNIIIKQNNKIILQKEVSHELEYFNVSGYVTSQLWFSPQEFHDVFRRLIKESLGELPSTNEKIIVGSLEAQEKKASSLLLNPTRQLLKINGAWNSASNFSALIETTNGANLDFYYKDKMIWNFPKPTFSDFYTPLFTSATGVSISFNEKITHQKKGVLFFSDGGKFGINLKWVEKVSTIKVKGVEVTKQNFSDPIIAELYNEKEQIGYFLYARLEEVRSTDKTEVKFNPFIGNQTQNTLGIEQIHRIEGLLYNKPLFAEYNENSGIIEIRSGEERLGIMVVQNCNPENQSIANATLSKNKHFVTTTYSHFGKPSMEKTKSVEWYPIYFPENATEESRKVAIKTLVCLFFGIGSM
jgi:hypothetical protein